MEAFWKMHDRLIAGRWDAELLDVQ